MTGVGDLIYNKVSELRTHEELLLCRREAIRKSLFDSNPLLQDIATT